MVYCLQFQLSRCIFQHEEETLETRKVNPNNCELPTVRKHCFSSRTFFAAIDFRTKVQRNMNRSLQYAHTATSLLKRKSLR